MATSYSTKLKLRKPAQNDRSWHTPVNENVDILDGTNAVGALAVTLNETPSTTLTVAVAAGPYLKTWGQSATYAGGTIACTASNTNYLYLDSAGTLTKSTSSFPASAAHIPLATVVAGGTTITSIADARSPIRMVVPNAQPTMGAATAGATYTSAEQTMLNAVYSAVRTLGLGT